MKSIDEINDKIRKGKAVVVTAEQVITIAKEKGIKKAAENVDVVTTGTFGPMCSSGAFLNFGHSKPRMKMGGGIVCLNAVPAYTGLAAVDVYLGATAMPHDDPANTKHPGDFSYGGAHVIEDLVAGKRVALEATAYGTDCYPRKEIQTWISLEDINEAILFNPRNAYQNYNVAVNLSDSVLYTYMGILKPRLGNANFCSAGQLSPLLKDPLYKSIGIGTRIFLGGGVGYVAWNGTQHNPGVPRGTNDEPLRPAGTLAVIGDLRGMHQQWLRGVSMWGYGVSLMVGIGVPIPIVSEEILRYAAIGEDEITAPVVDYSKAYPQRNPEVLGEVSYAQLRSGTIQVLGRDVRTASLSSYAKAREIAGTLKTWIQRGDFLLSDPVSPIPGTDAGIAFKPLEERQAENSERRRS